MTIELTTLLACPTCHGALARSGNDLVCTRCGCRYRVDGEIPVMLPIAESDRAAAVLDAHKAHQASFYDEEDPEFEITRPHGTPNYYRWLLEEKFRRSVAALGDLHGQTVLTVCGGSGMDAEFLARAGAQVIASDISPGAAQRTAERARRFGVAITPIVADVEHLPFPDQSVDIVYVHDGLHHLELPLIGLKEMARVAKYAVSVTEPYDAALTGLAVRVGIAQAIEEAGNRVARLNERDITATLMEAGLPIMHVDRYAMYYKHRPGPVMQALSLPGIEPVAQVGWQVANAVLGRAGNKLTIQAMRR